MRFTPAPTDLAARCPDLANARYDQQLWIYAEAPDGAARVMVVAGRFVPRRAGDAPILNDHGAVLRLGPDGCALIGPAAEPFAMPAAYDDTVPAPIRAALATDAARRYAAAFGPGGLARAMRAAGKRLGTAPPGLRAAFSAEARLPR